MRGNEFLDKLELVDPAYVEAADAEPKKRRRFGWAAAAACLCVLAAVIAAALIRADLKPQAEGSEKDPENEGFHLSERTTAKVYRGYVANEDGTPPNQWTNLLAEFSEEQMFAMDDIAIFRGTVTEMQNVTIDFNGELEHFCIAAVDVTKVYKGEITPGAKTDMLLLCAVGLEDAPMIEDTCTARRLRPGMEGIFMPMVYDDEDIWGLNGAVLIMRDLAPCGLGDCVRWAFIANDGGVIFDRDAYRGARRAHSLDEIEEYVLNMLGE